MSDQGTQRFQAHGGFSVLEVLVAVSVLAFGLLSLGSVLTTGLTRLGAAPADLIARQKASEAIECVYAARDTRLLTWAQIRNARGGSGSDGGIFLDGPQPLRSPGPDGLVNTTDDGDVESLVQPGPDGLLGTDDDILMPMSQYTREIEIRDLGGTLRQVRVIVKVRGAQGERAYILTTLVSAWA
ncbi:MAG: hypothetical protein AB1806_03230 [Acidobacteriota bacterium]